MKNDLFDITGRVALVTGSGRGIGYALAKGLLGAGCSVVLNDRDPEVLERARAQLATETGGEVHAMLFDVTDPGAVTDGGARAEAEAGPIDILVNNAGMQYRSNLVELPDEMWDKMLGTNLTSAFLVGREVARRMVPRGKG